MSEESFYTYLYLREDGSPYYVGKGKGKRFRESTVGHRPPKDRSRIHINNWSDEATAFAFEIYQIDFWGRKDLETGILRNRTDGGEGGAGAVYSIERRGKISQANRKRSWSKEDRRRISAERKQYFLDHPLSLKEKRRLRSLQTPEVRAKIAEASRHRTEEQCRNLSLAIKASWARRRANA